MEKIEQGLRPLIDEANELEITLQGLLDSIEADEINFDTYGDSINLSDQNT